MRSIWLLLFVLLSIFCFSSLPVAYAQGGDDAEDYDDVADDDEEVEYVDDDEEVEEGEDEDEEEEDEEEYGEEDDLEEIGPSDDVITFSLLPDYPDKRMIVGEKVLVLMNFVNKGESKFNLTEVGAFLHSPFDFNYYMHNFTAKPLGNAIVEPHTHFSVEYSFTPEVNLIDGSLEYTMSTYLTYNSTGDEPEQFKSTVFNKTVTLIEPPNSVDIKRFFTRFLLIAGVGLLIYIGVGVFNKNRSKKSDSKVERGTKSLDSVDDSWEFTKYVPKPLSVKRGSKKRSGKLKKKRSGKRN